jgi:hypothetical protein
MRALGVVFVVGLLLLGAVCQPLAASVGAAQTGEDRGIEKTMTSMSGVDFHLSFDPRDHRLSVAAVNPKERTVETGFVVRADERVVVNESLHLASGERWNETVTVRSSLDALRDVHVVRVSTYGATRAFEFEYPIDAENASDVPTPYIADATVSQGTVDGERSTVVNVTVTNPSNQQYPTKLMVHTEGTDGSFYAAIVPPGESETVTVELLDDAGTTVGGEARLYAGRFNESDGGIDQIGFRGRVDGSTATWNESYEAVEGPWSDDPYRYENASVGDDPDLVDRVSGGREVRGVPIVVPGAVVVLAVAGLVVARRR